MSKNEFMKYKEYEYSTSGGSGGCGCLLVALGVPILLLSVIAFKGASAFVIGLVVRMVGG